MTARGPRRALFAGLFPCQALRFLRQDLRFWIAVPAGTSFFCDLDWPWPAGGGSSADADSATVVMSLFTTSRLLEHSTIAVVFVMFFPPVTKSIQVLDSIV